MREYKITKGDLGYYVFRRKEEDGIEKVEWLQDDSYSKFREQARTFYHLNDAMSAFTIAKAKGRKEGTESVSKKETDSKKGVAKSYWGELS